MSGKSNFFDYEPLTRPKRSPTSEIEGFKEPKDVAAVSESETGFDEINSLNAQAKNRQTPHTVGGSATETKDVSAEAIIEKKESWILKRGHAISFAGLFLFTFIVFFRPYELSPSLAWLSTSAFWVAIFTVAVFLPTQLGLEQSFTSRPREVNLILLFTLACALSIPLATDRGRAADSLVEYLKVVLMFIVLINVVRTEARLRVLLFLIFAGTFLLSVVALNDYIVGNLGIRGDRITGVIGGLFDNPNDLALHLVTMMPLAFVLGLSCRSLIKKTLWLALVLLMGAAVMATFSRGGFMAMAAVSFGMAWKLARRNRILLALGLVMMIVAFVAVGPADFRKRLTTTGDGSVSARQDELKRSLFVAARHPVVGVGMDNYILYSNFGHASHNSYTQVASDLGVAATVLYVLFVIAPIKRLRRLEAEEHQEKKKSRFYYLSIGLQVSLLGYLVASFFASVAYLWYVYYLVGYSVSLRRIVELQRQKFAETEASTLVASRK